MSTTFTVGDHCVGCRSFRQGSARVQFEFTEKEWFGMERDQVVKADNGQTWDNMDDWFNEMKSNHPCVFMNRFVKNSRRNEMKKLAKTWSKKGFHNFAHFLTLKSQEEDK